MVQARHDRFRRKHLRPRRGKLDRQRQAVEPAQISATASAFPPSAERHGSRPARVRRRDAPRGCARHRRTIAPAPAPEVAVTGILLARHVQHGTAGDQNSQVRRALDQARDERRRREDVLEVVEDQQGRGMNREFQVLGSASTSGLPPVCRRPRNARAPSLQRRNP